MSRRLIRVGLVAVLAAGVSTAGHLLADENDPPGITVNAKRTADKKNGSKKVSKDATPALNFKMKDIDGRKQDLRQYHGQVVMMVNVATYCGLTPQYEQLQSIYKEYSDRGFVILGFPANNFGKQEPDPNEKIKEFCTSKFDVTFPMFAKVSVKGEDICPLYKYLTDEKAAHKKGGDIEWNFCKFLIDRNGQVVERFSPRIKPDDSKVVEAIEVELKKPVPENSPYARSKKNGGRGDVKVSLARAAIGPNGPLSAAIDLFKVNCGVWPEELRYLYDRPEDEELAKKWIQGLKHRSGLKDPWGRDYQYRAPGEKNKDSFDLWSMGPDGLDGTEDDITNW